ENQDQFFAGEISRGIRLRADSFGSLPNTTLLGDPTAQILMVADGMGGHKAGHEASKLAVQYFMAAILNRLQSNDSITPDDHEHYLNHLRDILSDAHQEIRRISEASEDKKGMGTTFTMAYIVWPKLAFIHAGDTRCYVFRAGQLSLLTLDHTVANEMIKNGQLNLNDNERSPWSNVLVNALGAGAEGVQGDLATTLLEPGDIVLMCSDGLNKHVNDTTIEKVLAAGGKVQSICESLVQLAKKGGGTDNITVVAARWTKSGKSMSMSINAIPPSDKQNVVIEFLHHTQLFSTTDIHTTDLTVSTEPERSGDTDPLTTEAF
ncbi:MAG: Serine/threonine phosphatase stp, partial [Planctomycetota bacterium]